MNVFQWWWWWWWRWRWRWWWWCFWWNHRHFEHLQLWCDFIYLCLNVYLVWFWCWQVTRSFIIVLVDNIIYLLIILITNIQQWLALKCLCNEQRKVGYFPSECVELITASSKSQTPEKSQQQLIKPGLTLFLMTNTSWTHHEHITGEIISEFQFCLSNCRIANTWRRWIFMTFNFLVCRSEHLRICCYTNESFWIFN